MKKDALELFNLRYPGIKPFHMKSHGRLEICGNHTDHNNGLCLVSGVNLGIDAYFAKRDDGFIEIRSVGYPPYMMSIYDLTKRKKDEGTSLGLTRGIVSRMKSLGYRIGGFSCTMESNIFPGAGVSSSACYESLIVGILSFLYNDNKVSPLEMAKIGRYSEVEYFGKPCGLLDQIATSFGGIDYLDFKSNDEPLVIPMSFHFPLQIVLVNTGGSHSKLTRLYAEIPDDMRRIASEFGKSTLREVNPSDFFHKEWGEVSEYLESCISRATHYFNENERVERAKDAILENDVDAFLKAINESGESSSRLLRNTMVHNRYAGSPQEACDRAKAILNGQGACRIMGGGFAGSIICFVPKNEAQHFIASMSKSYGSANVKAVEIVEGGPALVE